MPSRRASPLPDPGAQQPWTDAHWVSASGIQGAGWAAAATEGSSVLQESRDGNTGAIDLFGDPDSFLWADGMNFDLMNELFSSIGAGDQMGMQGW
jgi:hypothetical protein